MIFLESSCDEWAPKKQKVCNRCGRRATPQFFDIKKGFLNNQEPWYDHLVGDTGFEPVTSTV